MAKNARGPNFSPSEEDQLVQLVAAFRTTLENKRTDATTLREKKNAWEEVELRFNARSTVPRSAAALRDKFMNMKRRIKKEVADEKRGICKTGGGPPLQVVSSSVSQESRVMLLDLMKSQATGSISHYDNDADDPLDFPVPELPSPYTVGEETIDEVIITEADVAKPAAEAEENNVNGYEGNFPGQHSKTAKWGLKQPLPTPLAGGRNPKRTRGIKSKLMSWVERKVSRAQVEEAHAQERHEQRMRFSEEKHNFKMETLKEKRALQRQLLEQKLLYRKMKLEKN